MRKIVLFIPALFLFSVIPHGEANGQKFLNKLNNALDKGINAVDRAVDKVLGNGPVTHTYSDDHGVTITTWSPEILFDIESCVREEDEVTLNYILRNSGPAFKITRLGTGKSDETPRNETFVTDNLDNSCEIVYYNLGGVGSVGDDITLDLNIPGESRLRGTIEIKGVSPQADTLKVVNIAGLWWDESDKSWPVDLTFENVAILDLNDILSEAVPVETIEEPYTNRRGKGGRIRRVVITDRDTRVDMEYNNDTDRAVDLWLDNKDKRHIAVGSVKYPWTSSCGIASRSGKRMIEPGATCVYTLIYQPIPQWTDGIVVHEGDGSAVTLLREKPLGVEIPRMTGAMTLEDSYDKHDNLPRLTPAQRAELKIDQIKLKDFKTSWANSELAMGKTVYESELGKLRTVFFLNPDTYTGEYLLSYDPDGNLIDCIQIGSIHVWGGDRGQGLFEGDKLEVSFESPEGGTYLEYKITPELKFQKIKEELQSWD